MFVGVQVRASGPAGFGIQFREIGEIRVTLGKGAVAMVSAKYGLSIYKDWNFDYGKTALGIPSDSFANMPAYGDAQTFILTGFTELVVAPHAVATEGQNVLV